ncbi:hypothetical protein GP2143_17391 [marine gamma proteobacterium HTCC2143]|uniref:Uncharacterized protein n=1 Tax=marine gamma proteobacterium HTCC2143 TaxID=247633 RepID=A0YA98_9GAMM|nr:hypothetical protein GP2143_17391 [marine gamma proteobacterium HTCC2143]
MAWAKKANRLDIINRATIDSDILAIDEIGSGAR